MDLSGFAGAESDGSVIDPSGALTSIESYSNIEKQSAFGARIVGFSPAEGSRIVKTK